MSRIRYRLRLRPGAGSRLPQVLASLAMRGAAAADDEKLEIDDEEGGGS